MTVTSASVRWSYTRYDTVTEALSYGTFNVGAGSPCLNGSSLGESTRYEYYQRGGAPIKLLSFSGTNNDGFVVILSGNLQGACFVPPNTPSQTDVSGMFMHLPLVSGIQGCIKQSSDFPDGFDDISDNGQYYKDDYGNWHNITDDTIVATASQVSNLPPDVDFNGWLIDGEVIVGSDGNYYDTSGNQVFQNLPSGVIPSSTSIDGLFSGSDGNYYDIEGNQLLENLPSGVTPQSQIGNLYVGSDGNYYKSDGSAAMSNLPSGVSIVGYDPVTGDYLGSDGNNYDIDGDKVSYCSGQELVAGNSVRLSINYVSLTGDEGSIVQDVSFSDTSISLPATLGIRQIKSITCRNLVSGSSIGNTRLIIRGDIIGFRVEADIPDIVDPDFYIGVNTVATCVFSTCDKYAQVVLNPDLPIGYVPNIASLNVGIYCLVSSLSLSWDIDHDTQFPFCCGSYNEASKESGSTSENVDKDDSDLVEAIDRLTDAVKALQLCVEVCIENGLYADVRKVNYQPILDNDD